MSEGKQKLLARIIGIALLAAFALGAYQTAVMTSDGLLAAAEAGEAAFAKALQARMVLDSAMSALAVLLAIGFFFLLQPVNAGLALLASLLRLVSAGFAGFGVYAASTVIADDSMNAGSDSLLRAARDLNALYFDLFHWGLIAASLSAAVIFALLFASRYAPRLLAGYGFLASLGAVVGASSLYLAPALSDLMYPAYVAANALAFISLALWLTVFSVNTSYWRR